MLHVLSSPKARLITFSKTRLIKFYLNRYLMTDPIYVKSRKQKLQDNQGKQAICRSMDCRCVCIYQTCIKILHAMSIFSSVLEWGLFVKGIRVYNDLSH